MVCLCVGSCSVVRVCAGLWLAVYCVCVLDNETPVSARQGVLRINCIDCLDRTNAACVMMGKCALEHQVRIVWWPACRECFLFAVAII